MERFYLDTHILLWRYFGFRKKFSKKVLSYLDTYRCIISPVVLLEMQYLQEIGRIKILPSKIIKALCQEISLQIADDSFKDVIIAASKQSWTRDPFDRIIVGQASLTNSKLISADQSIRDNYAGAAW